MQSERADEHSSSWWRKPKGEEVLLIAEDDDDDYFLTREAMRSVEFGCRITRAKDGEELLDYLLRRGAYADPRLSPTPTLILLDLNMPRSDGRQALKTIKAHPVLRRIPIIVLTTSAAPDDVRFSYDHGANAYIRKPLEFGRYVDVIQTIKKFWLATAEPASLETNDQ